MAEGSSHTASRRIRTVQCRLGVLAGVCVLWHSPNLSVLAGVKVV